MAKNPTIRDIPKSEWETLYKSDLVVVLNAQLPIAQVAGTSGYQIVARGTYGSFTGDFWLVKDLETGKQKFFFGETAWSDARRFASDIDFGAWAIN
jgi:hypothetical protein